MAKIVGCIEAHELTTCKQGANQHSHIILRKSVSGAAAKTAPLQPTPENDEMDFAITKALLAMDDITKAHALTLSEEALKAFLATSVEDQKKTAHDIHDAAEADAKKAKDAAESAAAAAGDTTKSVADLQKRVNELEAEKAVGVRDGELRKSIRDDEALKGFPGGEDAAFIALKAVDKLDDATKATVLKGLHAQAAMAKTGALEIGGLSTEDLEKSMPATAKLRKKVEEVMEADGTTYAAAQKKVSEMPAYKAVFADAMKEEGIV